MGIGKELTTQMNRTCHAASAEPAGVYDAPSDISSKVNTSLD
jgi:hypothetical protein